MRTDTVSTVPQTVLNHKLQSLSVLRPAASQDRLHGVLGRNSMFVGQCATLQACYGLLPARTDYMACWVESLCLLVSLLCSLMKISRALSNLYLLIYGEAVLFGLTFITRLIIIINIE